MSQGAIIAGAFVMAVCCSTSSAAMLMMGGDEEKTTTGPGPSSPGPGPTGPGPADPLTCSSPGSPSLSGKYWIVSADGQRSANRMIFLGASGTDGRAQLAEWDYWADPATKWDIKEVPGEAGTYWIVSDANQRSANRMIFLGDSGTDGRAQLAEWDYWADPATKWKLLADPKAPGEYWIVSADGQRSPCRMIFLGDSGTDGRAQLAEWDFWEDSATKWKLTPAP